MRKGKGEPLLLIHGLGGSARIWAPIIDLLALERDTIALDLPGFGDAPALGEAVEPTAVNLAAALHRACEGLGVDRPHVAGNSLGGWVGLEMGRAGWAASVTALSPAGLWQDPLGDRRFDSRRLARRLRPLVSAALRMRRTRNAMLATFAARPERIPPIDGRALVLGWIDSIGYEATNRAMRSQVFDPAGYPEIPVTLAWSQLDRIVAPPRRERMPAGARYLVMPGVGHTPTWDDPGLVAATVLRGSGVSSVI